MERNKERIVTDFMGTLNSPKAKSEVWGIVQKLIKEESYDALKESGFSERDIDGLRKYTSVDPMTFREEAMKYEGMKKKIGLFVSVGSESGDLDDVMAVYNDAVEFLINAKLNGYNVDILSTVGAPEGRRGSQEIMLSKIEIPKDFRDLVGAYTADQLIRNYIGSKLKKENPGMAVLEEAKKEGIMAYLDDANNKKEPVIDSVVNTFGEQQRGEIITLPYLIRAEREGVKNPGYVPPEQHNNIGDIIVVKTLMDEKLTDKLFYKEVVRGIYKE